MAPWTTKEKEKKSKNALEAMHLFLVANLVTTSKALVTRSDALVPSSEPCYY